MNPDSAYDMLEVLKDVCDAMLITRVHHEGLWPIYSFVCNAS
jgi:hypothetical protein